MKLSTIQGRLTAEDKGRCAPASCSAIPCDEETWLLIRDLRNALAAASRVIVSCFATDVFIAETKKCGIPDGIGTRSQKWLDARSPNEKADR